MVKPFSAVFALVSIAACGGGHVKSSSSSGGSSGASDSRGGSSASGDSGGDSGTGDSGGGGSSDGGAPGGAPGPSCAGLPENCGPNHDQDCCASTLIPGGFFLRNNGATGQNSAFASPYRLDVYEVTVGRFKQFLDGYEGHLPVVGTGNNPGNSSDTGWSAEWDAALVGHDELVSGIKSCMQTVPAYASDDNDLLPMSCITWFEAYAFCIWDGGRLPTNVEWNFAAAGGDQQREYPWSNPPHSHDIDPSYAVYYQSEDPNAMPRPEDVGSRSPKGDARWGQADMTGNVWEWNQDWYTVLPDVCFNCAALNGMQIRTMVGGSYYGDGESLLSSSRLYHDPYHRDFVLGVRCARAP